MKKRVFIFSSGIRQEVIRADHKRAAVKALLSSDPKMFKVGDELLIEEMVGSLKLTQENYGN